MKDDRDSDETISHAKSIIRKLRGVKVAEPEAVGTQLYPKPVRESPRGKHKKLRPWRIEYDLGYDGGGVQWAGYYRTYTGARIAAWWNVHISSWGGSAVLHNQYKN